MGSLQQEGCQVGEDQHNTDLYIYQSNMNGLYTKETHSRIS